MTAATRSRPRPELAQRPAADPDASVWVSASAGTGKTKVLTDRVLRLLLAGTQPQRILCLTFTKAAAAEMSTRIAERLGQWAVADDLALARQLTELTGRPADGDAMTAARRLFARVLDAPGGLAIQTIHGFCQSLLRRFPIEAGIAPHFTVMDERSAAEMLADARARMLVAARDHDAEPLSQALAEITRHVTEDAFADLMFELTTERGRLDGLIRAAGGVDALIQAIHRRLRAKPGGTDADLCADASAEHAFDGAALRRAAAALTRGSKTDQTRAAAMSAWLAEPAQRAAGFDAYAAVYLTDEGEIRKNLATKQALKIDGAIDASLRAEAARILNVQARRRALLVARATAALLSLGHAMLAAYQAEKQRGVLLDYDDLVLAARDLLHRPGVAPWVLYKLDGGIDHILVDEAQDTNPEQWQIVEALAAEFFAGAGAESDRPERTVFAVGDAKQSIFSFQGADPAAFERMRRDFSQRIPAAGASWREVPLDVSFRSADAVLRAVDAVFARHPARDGVAIGDQTIHHETFRAGQAGLVELWPPALPPERGDIQPWQPPVAISTAEAPRARVARLVALQIHRWISTGERLESKGRAIRAGDIMILVRRRGSFVGEVVRALKNLGIPVAGVDRMVLTQQLAIMDLVALGQFLLLPEDDLNLATVLKGPLIGLSEERLFELAHGRGGRLWLALRQRAHENADFAHAFDQLSALLARADLMPPYELFARVLGEGRGRAKILSRLGPDAADPLDEFLNAALLHQRQHPPSLQGFLHWLGAAAEEIKRDLEQGARDEVRVMTVHGAKGLQAPIVILPDTIQKPERLPRLLWPPSKPGATDIVLWPPRTEHDEAVASAARALARDKRDREYRRLLYVAMTRAEDRLYVCGWANRKAASADCWYKLIQEGLDGIATPLFFDFSAMFPRDLGPGGNGAWAGDGFRLTNAQTAETEPERVASAEPLTIQAAPEWLLLRPSPEPSTPHPLTPSSARGDNEPATRPPFGGDGGQRFHRGRVLHRLLQILPGLPAERRAAAARAFLARPVLGLAREAQAEIQAEVLAVLNQPDAKTLFGEDSRAEVPITGQLGRAIITGQIDRLAVLADRVVLADYKTNREPPADAGLTPAIYLRQMALYRALLGRIYPDKSIYCYIVWTFGPRLVHLEADLLDRHLPVEARFLDAAAGASLDSG